MAAETNVMQFDTPISFIVKIDESLGIVNNKSLMICSPFKVTRPLTGMHNSFFEHTHPIQLACHFFYDCSLAEQVIGERFPYAKVREYFFLVYDVHEQFVVLDGPRCIIISKFYLKEEHKSPVIGIAGHPTNLGEVAILTKKAILRIHIELDDYQLISETPLLDTCYSIRPFLSGYLVQSNTSLDLLNDSGLHLYKNIPPNSIIYNEKSTIVCISPVKSSIFKINVLSSGMTFGLSHLEPDHVDICEEYLVSFHKSIDLNIMDLTNPKRQFSTKLSQEITDCIGLFAGMNSTKDSLIIIVFAPKYGVCVSIPVSELNIDV